MIENELLKHEKFKGCTPSIDCQYYQKELRQNNGDISNANTNFVLSYWQNSKNNPLVNQTERNRINSRYFFYAEQAYHQALLLHDPKFKQTSTNRTTALNSVRKYAQRMTLKGISPELFLQNGFDNVLTSQNFQEGITVLNLDGTKYLNLTPTSKVWEDKVTFFNNNQPNKVVLKNIRTGNITPFNENSKGGLLNQLGSCSFPVDQSSQPQSKQIENLSALEIAIEKGNMGRVYDIVSKDPSIINRQMPVSKKFPLLVAIQNNNAEASSFILTKNPNLLLKTEDGKTILDELDNLKNDKITEQIRLRYVAQEKNLNSVFEGR